MLTLTAGGDHVHCGRHTNRRGQRCNFDRDDCEPCPCTPPDGTDLAEFNRTLTSRLNDLLTDLRRGAASPIVKGRQPNVPIEYLRAVEVQKRGALHVHLPLVRSDGRPLHLSKKRLRALAIRHKFGCQMVYDWKPSPAALASYVSKYVSKAADERHDVPWLADEASDEERDKYRRSGAGYRPWTRSRSWGASMKGVKEMLRERARQRALAEGDEVAPLDPYSESYANEAAERAAEERALALLQQLAAPPPSEDRVVPVVEVEVWVQGTFDDDEGWA